MSLDNVSKKSEKKIEAEKRVKESMRQYAERLKEQEEEPENVMEEVPRREEIAPVRATKVKINFNTL